MESLNQIDLENCTAGSKFSIEIAGKTIEFQVTAIHEQNISAVSHFLETGDPLKSIIIDKVSKTIS